MEKKLITICLALCFFLGTTLQVQSAVKEGWKTVKNHKVYYVNGKKYKEGWKKIGDYKYYFEADTGYMAANKIVGDEKDGYYYVGEDGIRCKDATIKKAVKLVTQHSNSNEHRRLRLKKCFYEIIKGSYVHMSESCPKASDLPQYANYMYRYKKGNCYRFAASIAYVGKVLGYDTRLVAGYVSPSHASHGWAEMKADGKYVFCDGSFARRARYPTSFFMKDRKNHTRTLYVAKTYQITVKKGNVIWKTVK